MIAKLASTNEDKIRAYKVRYNVFTIEMENTVWSNHKNKTFIDPWDISLNYCFVVIKDDLCIATTRIVLKRERLLQFDEHLPLETIANNTGISLNFFLSNLAYSERTAIVEKFRGIGIFKTLFDQVHDCLKNYLNVKYVLGLIRKDNLRAIKAYKKLGYECEIYFLNVKGFEMTICFKIL